MITRIVRLSIAPVHKDYFITLFNATYESIRHYKGCHHLELWEDTREAEVLITLSKWENEDALDDYRSSDLFKSTWSKVKPLFSAPPFAFSMKRLYPSPTGQD